MTLKIGVLTNLCLFFSLACFVSVFDQTLVEHLALFHLVQQARESALGVL